MRDGWCNGSATSAADRERGAVLLLALILTTTFALMAWSLLASSDFAARARLGGAAQEQAERAAASGIEWAAAAALDGSLVDGRTSLTLADGSQVAVVVATASSPQVVARARSRGAEVAFGADLRPQSGAPLPHALVAYGSASRLSMNASCSGSAWFGGTPPFFAGMTGVLGMSGDLQLVTTVAIDPAVVSHTSGSTQYGQRAFDLPGIDTTPFATMLSGAVTVTRYVGNNTLTGQTITGIVIVDLEAGQTLQLRNTTINGTLVVRSVVTGVVGSGLGLLGGITSTSSSTSGGGGGDGGGGGGGGGSKTSSTASTTSTGGGTIVAPPTVRLTGASSIVGGTAWTGNLAILGAECMLDAPSSTGSTLRGVVIVKSLDAVKNVDVVGQLVLLDCITSTSGSFTVTRPTGFVPNTPLGVTWPGTKAVRIDWRGPQ